MTTFIKRLRAKASKRTLLLFGMLLLGSGSYAQLDSVSVTLTFAQETTLDSLGGTDTLDYMNANVYTDDVDFLGEVIVTVYDKNSNFPLGKLKYTKQEAVNAGILSGSITTLRFDDQNPSGAYRVEAIVRNYQGANLPLVTVEHN